MGRDREKLIRAYWSLIEKDQNYASTKDFYTDESVLIDPVYGPFSGRQAINDFLEQVTEDMKGLNITFSVTEIAGGGDVGWSRWSINLPDGNKKEGVSVYRFKEDKILLQRDYIGTHQLD